MGNTALKNNVRKYKETQREVGETLQSWAVLVRKEERKSTLYKVFKDVMKVLPTMLALIPGGGVKLKFLTAVVHVVNGRGSVHLDKSDEESKMHHEKIIEVLKTLDKLIMKRRPLVKSLNRCVLKKYNIKYGSDCNDDVAINPQYYVKYGHTVMEAVDVLNDTFKAIRLSQSLNSGQQTQAPEPEEQSVINTELKGCIGSSGGSTAKTAAFVGLVYPVQNIVSNIFSAARNESEAADVLQKIADVLKA